MKIPGIPYERVVRAEDVLGPAVVAHDQTWRDGTVASQYAKVVSLPRRVAHVVLQKLPKSIKDERLKKAEEEKAKRKEERKKEIELELRAKMRSEGSVSTTSVI